jgi:hypothetical protein
VGGVNLHGGECAHVVCGQQLMDRSRRRRENIL